MNCTRKTGEKERNPFWGKKREWDRDWWGPSLAYKTPRLRADDVVLWGMKRVTRLWCRASKPFYSVSWWFVTRSLLVAFDALTLAKAILRSRSYFRCSWSCHVGKYWYKLWCEWVYLRHWNRAQMKEIINCWPTSHSKFSNEWFYSTPDINLIRPLTPNPTQQNFNSILLASSLK